MRSLTAASGNGTVDQVSVKPTLREQARISIRFFFAKSSTQHVAVRLNLGVKLAKIVNLNYVQQNNDFLQNSF